MLQWSRGGEGECAQICRRGVVVNRYFHCMRGVVVGTRFFHCMRGLVAGNRFFNCVKGMVVGDRFFNCMMGLWVVRNSFFNWGIVVCWVNHRLREKCSCSNILNNI